MKKIFTLTALFFAGMAFAQAPSLVWHGAFGGVQNDAGTSMSLAPDGSLYVTGNFSGTVDFDPGTGVENRTSEGSVNIFIQKLSATGSLVWVKTFNLNTVAFSSFCKSDAQGNVYIAAQFTGTADLDPGAGVANSVTTIYNNSAIIKLDANGNYLWSRAMEPIGNSPASIYAIQADAAGNVYTGGYYTGSIMQGSTTVTSAGGLDSFIQKHDANGNAIWLKSFGGTEIDFAAQIVTDGTGNIFVTGIFQGTSDLDPGAGQFNVTGKGMTDAFITKLSPEGEFIWTTTLGGNDQEGFGDVKIDGNGDIYIAAASNSTVMTLPTLPETNFTTNGDFDAMLLKLDSAGNFLWTKSFGGAGADRGLRLVFDTAGRIVIAGQFFGTINFSPLGTTVLTGPGAGDLYITCFNTDGTFAYAYALGGGTAYDYLYEFFTDSAGDYYLLGLYSQSADIDPSAETTTITSNGYEDFYVAKYHPEALAAGEFETPGGITLYPNPSDGNFTLQGNGIEGAQVTIYNQLGSAVRQYTIKDTSSPQSLAQGIYFVEIIANGKRDIKKLIIK